MKKIASFIALFLLSISLVGCGSSEPTVTVYSGRGQDLVEPLFDEIEQSVPFEIEVRYGNSAELATAMIEEGENTPADLFYSQSAGALGALQKEGQLAQLSGDILETVPASLRSNEGRWVGITGRARVINYNVNDVDPGELPETIWDLTDERWQGEVGWAPQNASFQAFVTALRTVEGEDRARQWLKAMIDNDVRSYPKNTPIVAALGRGEIKLGLVNNYYLHRFKSEDPDFPVAAHFTSGDAGSMINVSGAGVSPYSDQPERAERVIRELLSEPSQRYFAGETYEYPLIDGVSVQRGQKPLDEIRVPDLDLSDLDDLNGTLDLLRDVGAL